MTKLDFKNKQTKQGLDCQSQKGTQMALARNVSCHCVKYQEGVGWANGNTGCLRRRAKGLTKQAI